MTLGLLEKRIEGDDALMQLARLRFQQAKMGAEMHAATPEQLEWVMRFRPSGDGSAVEGAPTAELPVVVHLPRQFNLLSDENRRQIAEMASRFAGRIYAMVIHDHPDLVSRSPEFGKAAE